MRARLPGVHVNSTPLRPVAPRRALHDAVRTGPAPATARDSRIETAPSIDLCFVEAGVGAGSPSAQRAADAEINAERQQLPSRRPTMPKQFLSMGTAPTEDAADVRGRSSSTNITESTAHQARSEWRRKKNAAPAPAKFGGAARVPRQRPRILGDDHLCRVGTPVRGGAKACAPNQNRWPEWPVVPLVDRCECAHSRTNCAAGRFSSRIRTPAVQLCHPQRGECPTEFSVQPNP